MKAVLQTRLSALEGECARRSLRIHSGVDFCSNDYLGFAADEWIGRETQASLGHLPNGATASRLLRGEMEVFERAEAVLTQFVSQPAALIFSSGYQANVGLLSALLRAGDVVFSDALNHASIIDGIRLSRAECVIYRHNDTTHLRDQLRQHAGKVDRLKLIVTESVFSMEGDQAPLKSIVALAEEFSCSLVVDEAHATGMYGETGGGLVQALRLSQHVLATTHTGGKALGAGGAWVAGSLLVKEYLVNFSRAFMYSTAPLPLLAVTLQYAVQRWQAIGQERAAQVIAAANQLRTNLRQHGLNVPGDESPIVPILLGKNEIAVHVAKQLSEQGFDVRAIRPPTVPAGTARLRLTIPFPSLPHVTTLQQHLVKLFFQ